MVLIADGQDVTIEMGFRSNLLRFRRLGRLSQSLMIPVLKRFNLRLYIRFRWLGRFELFPKNNRILGLLLPTR